MEDTRVRGKNTNLSPESPPREFFFAQLADGSRIVIQLVAQAVQEVG